MELKVKQGIIITMYVNLRHLNSTKLVQRSQCSFVGFFINNCLKGECCTAQHTSCWILSLNVIRWRSGGRYRILNGCKICIMWLLILFSGRTMDRVTRKVLFLLSSTSRLLINLRHKGRQGNCKVLILFWKGPKLIKYYKVELNNCLKELFS